MKNCVTAFFMAWGNFLTLPCPVKRWNDKLKNLMLVFFPSVGAVIGILLAIIFYCIMREAGGFDSTFQNVAYPVIAVALEYFMFKISGYMHLDGFMDCADAILSRGSLEKKQQILKDSHVGAFAVISVIFLLLWWYAVAHALIVLSSGDEVAILAAALVPIMSRGSSSLWLMRYKPMATSQYAKNTDDPRKSQYCFAVIGQMLFFLSVYILLGTFCLDVPFADGAMLGLAVTLSVVTASYLVSLKCRGELGGMNGDISGCCITVSELIGMLTVVIFFLI